MHYTPLGNEPMVNIDDEDEDDNEFCVYFATLFHHWVHLLSFATVSQLGSFVVSVEN